jgi:RND family efflux transporter MFP subunit
MKRKNSIAISFVVIVLIAVIATLAINKHKINEANKPIDRSKTPVSVTVCKVSSASSSVEMTLPAKLKPYEEANVSVQTAGIISYLKIELGSTVRKGEAIGSINSKIAQLNLKSTLLAKEKLKDDYIRSKDLYAGNAASEVALKNSKYNYENTEMEAEQIKQQIANAQIIAPISGIITVRNLRAGEFANAGSIIASVADIHWLKATVFVDETEVYAIRLNQKVNVVSPVFPDKHLTGKVIFISPKGDENHNYQIDVLIQNTPEVLRAGTDVAVTFQNEIKQNRIFIPKRALISDRQDASVYVIKNNAAFVRKIDVGMSFGDSVLVAKGLVPGEIIVLSGQINLSEGSLVNILKQ